MWIDRVRCDQESWQMFQLGFREARRVAPELTWSGYLREALREYSQKFL